MKIFLRLSPGLFAAFIVSEASAAPVVSNLTATQRAGTKLVDISYDLVAPGFGRVAVTLEASSDGGATWTVPVASATGEVGGSVTPGTGKAIVWNAGVDWLGNYSTQMRFRVVADDLVLIPGGSFAMGRTSGDTDADAPSITVTVSPFYIQLTETTKAHWDEVRAWGLSNGYTDLASGAGKASNHPVHSVTWWDVVKWCNARSEKEGLTPVYTVSAAVMRTGTTEPTANWSANGYRLPTEAEWEKAARGGVSGKRFPWGTDTISHAQANYYGSSSNAYDQSPINNHHPSYSAGGFAYTSPVGSFAANQYGLYDMAGNVWEWSWDRYGSSYYTTSNGTTDPRGPASGAGRVLRGGGWGDNAVRARCAGRQYFAPGYQGIFLGFRPVCSSIHAATGSADSANVTVDTRVAPTVTSPSATSFTANGATLGGQVTSDGGAAISERGFVYAVTSANNDAVIGGPGVMKVVVAGTIGIFRTVASGLANAVNHTFKAYATNEKGVGYSLPGSFLPLGNNADLSSLTISTGTLSPGFSGNITAYNVTVGSEITSISVTPTVAESVATVKVNGTSLTSGNSSAPLNLNVGSNTLLVQVTAQNGSDLKTYSLNVVRPGPPKLTGTALTSYTGSDAVLGATVSESASGAVTSRGFVLATASLPTVGSATSFTASTGGLGSFSVTASGLTSGVRYFARPFAENQDGIGYGNEVSFTTDTPVNIGAGGVGQVANREIQAGEIQRFQLTLDSAKALELLLNGAGGGLQVRLRNASGSILETSLSGAISRKVLSGSYTIEIENTSGDPKTYTFDLDASSTISVTPAITLSPSSVISKKLKPVSSTATIRNAGELPDKLRVGATPGNRDFIVSYSNGGNLTAAIVAGTHETPILESIAPGSVVRISVTPNRKTLNKKGKIVRKTFSIQMTVSSPLMTTNSATGSVRVSTK